MGAVKALTFMCNVYVLLLLFFVQALTVKEQPLKTKLLEFYEYFNSIPRTWGKKVRTERPGYTRK